MRPRRRDFDPEGGIIGIGRFDELVTVQLRRAELLLSPAFDEATLHEGLSTGAISCLGLIAANPGISQKELSRFTGIDKAKIVAIVDQLEKAGWSVREKSRHDRRRNSLRATPAGEAWLERLVDTAKKLEHHMLASMSERDLRQLRKLLNQVTYSCAKQTHSLPSLPCPGSAGPGNRPLGSL